MTSTFQFNVQVSNLPPVFDGVASLEDVVVFVGDIVYYEVPTSQTDPDLNSVQLYLKDNYLPGFMMFDNVCKFTIVPVNLDAGLTVVTVVLDDGSMLTEYPFSILVIIPKIDPKTGLLIKTLENTGPPAFDEGIVTVIQILEGTVYELALP